MKFPTVANSVSSFPNKAICPWCKKNKVFEPHSMAMLCGGSLLVKKGNSVSAPKGAVEGAWLDISWHGAHDGGLGKDRDQNHRVCIAKNVQGGQFEIYFCSTKCLRAYLNSWVDQLERKIK